MKHFLAALFCLSAATAAHAQLRAADAEIEPAPTEEPGLQCLVDEGADFEMTLNGQRYGCYALPDGSTNYVILDENGNQYGDTGLGACPASLPAGHQCCIANGGACHTY